MESSSGGRERAIGHKDSTGFATLPSVAKAETDGDEDDISLTSTAESEFQDEYEVDTIHAQEYVDGNKMYLVKWKGYSDLRCTWEPLTSFNTGDTLNDWSRKKNAIKKGLRAPFDIAKWAAECQAFEDAREERKRRRREKRARLGLPLSGQKKTELGSFTRPVQSENSSSDKDGEPIGTSKERPHVQPAIQNQPQGIHTTSSQPRANIQPKASEQPKTLAPQTTTSQTQARTARRTEIPKAPPPTAVPFTVQGTRTERRDLAHVLHRARQQEQTTTDKNKTWKLFSTTHRFDKASQQDHEPNRNELELQNPKTWSPFQMSSSLRRPRPAESESLFVPQDDDVPEIQENSLPASPLTSTASPILHSRIPRASDYVAPAIPSTRNAPDTRTSSISDSPAYTSEILPPAGPRGWKPSKKGLRVGSRQLGKKSDILCTLSYGPDVIEVGDTLLCDLSDFTRQLVYKLKYRGEIRVRFDELCTLKHYQSMSDEINKQVLFNGYISAYADTQDRLSAFEKLLLDKDLVGVARICPKPSMPDHGLTFFCYPVKSKSFQFLNNNEYVAPMGSLCITGRSGVLARRPQNVELDSRDTRKKAQPYERPEREGRFGEPDKFETPQNMIPRQPPSKAPWPNDSSLEAMKNPPHTIHPGRVNQITDGPQNTRLDVSVAPVIDKDKETSNADSDSMDLSGSPILPTQKSLDNSTPKTAAAGEPNLPLPVDEAPNGLFSNQVPDDSQDVPMLDVGSVQNTDLFIKDVFPRTFRINFDQIAAITSRTSAKSTHCFYLWFPESADGDFQILERFLDSHCAIILSNRKYNDWEKFTKNPTGVALFHHTFLNYHELPGFHKLTMSPSFNFWNVSLSSGIPNLEPKTCFQRLFPQGTGYLMTEDFMLNERDAAIIILAWFRETAMSKIPGTTKMMFRPDVMNWLDRMSKEDPRFTVMAVVIGDTACQGDPLNWPTESRDLDCFMNPFLQSPVISLSDTPKDNVTAGGANSEGNNDSTHPKISPREEEADLLCEVFAAWAVLNATSLRRFHVITHAKPRDRWQKWQHIEIAQGANEFFQRWNINKDHYTKWLAQKPTARGPSSASLSPPGASPSSSAPNVPTTPSATPAAAMKSNTEPPKTKPLQTAVAAAPSSLAPPFPPRPARQ